MERYQKLGKNIALITVGNLLSKMMSFFLIPFYTAVLTTTEYGIADTLSTLVDLLLPVFTLLVYEALIRFSLEKDSDQTGIFSTGIAVGLLGMVVFALAAKAAYLFVDMPFGCSYLIVYYIAVSLHTLCSYFCRGVEKVLVYSLSGIIHTLCFLVLNILLLAVFKIGWQGYMISMIIGHFVATAYLVLHGKLYRYFKLRAVTMPMFKSMVQYSVPLIPNALTWWISNSSDKYMILLFCGMSATGIYSAAQRIPTMFATVSMIFASAWQISSAEDFGSKKTEQFFSNVYRQYSAFNCTILSVLILLIKPISSLLLSKDFAAGWEYVPLLLFAFLFHAMANFLTGVFTGSKKTKALFVSTLISAIANIALNAILLPLIGVQGAAIATLISYFLIWFVRLVASFRLMKLDWNKRNDILSYVLIGAEVACMLLLDTRTAIAVSIVPMALVMLLNFAELKNMLTLVSAMLKSRRQPQ